MFTVFGPKLLHVNNLWLLKLCSTRKERAESRELFAWEVCTGLFLLHYELHRWEAAPEASLHRPAHLLRIWMEWTLRSQLGSTVRSRAARSEAPIPQGT